MLNDLWTRAWAWVTKRDRGERFEVRLIFDDEEALTGKCGPKNKIYGWAQTSNIEKMSQDAATVPGIIRVEVIDRHMCWIQLQLKVHTMQSLNEPYIVATKPISVIPETAPVSLTQLCTEQPPVLLTEVAKKMPETLLGEIARNLQYKVAYGNDITIHRFRQLERDTDAFVVRRGNYVLDKEGQWHDREGRFLGYHFDSLLEAVRALLADDFQQLEDATALWFDRSEPVEETSPAPKQ